MKAQFKNYISLTKKEWNGIVVLLVLIAMVLSFPYVYQYFRKDNIINVTVFNTQLAEFNKANLQQPADNDKIIHVSLFKFNPNDASISDWEKLGLTSKQATTIRNYLDKGGKFYKPEDFKKIYGITEADYKRLQPYINIEPGIPKIDIVEINTADSAKLTTINGIGPAFATRILYYRERLGGFINKEQLKEVYGLDELKYKEIARQLKVDASKIRKVNINSISFDKLRLMPYLNYKQVNAIIEYRTQHGNYNSIVDMGNIAIIDEVILRKIEPYINFK